MISIIVPRSSFRQVFFVLDFNPVEASGAAGVAIQPERVFKPSVDGAALRRLEIGKR